MSHKTTRTAILVFGLFTALIHLVVLSLLMGQPAPMFILNGLGYLVLLWAFFANPGFVRERRALLHYAFIGYTALTIVAFFAAGASLADPLGAITKLAEVLLIVALVFNLRFERQA